MYSEPSVECVSTKTLDEVVARDPARIVCYERAGRDSNLLSHVLRTGSQVSVRKMIDEVMCQRVYGALPLSYGAMFENRVAPVGLEPTTSGS